MEIMYTWNEVQQPIKGSAFIDSASQSNWLNENHLDPQAVISRWQTSEVWFDGWISEILSS